jgi:hypothetical protein
MQTRKRKYTSPPPAPFIEKKRRAPKDDFAEDINYSSYFFRKDLISEFSTRLRETPDNYLSKYNLDLYNADDILEHVSHRGTTRTRAMLAANRGRTHQQRVENSRNIGILIRHLQESICGDAIDVNYAEASVSWGIQSDYSANMKKHYDIILLSSRNIEAYVPPPESRGSLSMSMSSRMSFQSPVAFNILESLPSSTGSTDANFLPAINHAAATWQEIIKFRLQGVVGFMVVEYGECKMFPHTYSINLICTSRQAPKGAGSILMGAYLHTVLSHPMASPTSQAFIPPTGRAKRIMRQIELEDEDITFQSLFVSDEPLIPVDHRAVLELAASYLNPGGLCTYEKFGFMYNSAMHGPNCFADYRNLPMMIDFMEQPGYTELTTEEKKQKIVDITMGKTSFPKSTVCTLRDEKIVNGKKKYIWEQTLLGCLKILKIYFDQGQRNKLDLADLRVQNLVPAMDSFMKKNNMTIEDLISYLETPESQRVPLNLNTLIRIVRGEEETQPPSPPAPRTTRRQKNKSHKVSKKPRTRV